METVYVSVVVPLVTKHGYGSVNTINIGTDGISNLNWNQQPCKFFSGAISVALVIHNMTAEGM